VKDILIPSEERRMDLNPLDFEEWLWATDGSGLLADAIDEAFRARIPLPDALHKLAMRSFREYLLVGGMPQSIEAYGADKDFFAADQAKRQILDVYRSDMFKYGGNDAAKVAAIFDQIPGQLSRHEKRFVIASLGSEARYREYAEAVFWLGDSHIANICRKHVLGSPFVRRVHTAGRSCGGNVLVGSPSSRGCLSRICPAVGGLFVVLALQKC
jgi:hypothetical protein